MGTMHTYIIWNLTAATKFRFLELIHEYEQVDEDSDAAEAIKEGIRSLPGYPKLAPDMSDFLLEVTDVMH